MRSPATEILLVEDDERISEEITDALRAAGFGLRAVPSLSAARHALEDTTDVLLLDLGLPDGDGLDLCRELRRVGRGLPILMLTARDAPDQRVRGLDVGADDYLIKPFHMPELLARVRSLLRRAGRSQSGLVKLGELWVDAELRSAGRGEQRLEFKPRELDLLLFLLRHPDRPWTRTQLLDRVWGQDYEGDARTVDIHVRRLRERIEDDPGRPHRLLTEWGVGYRMVDPSS